jgi:putative holliday junction resolvase
MGRILAIDYGAKRTGLAVTDPLQLFGQALETVPTENLLNFLQQYFLQEEVEKVIIGYPTKQNNEDTHSTPLIRDFIKDFEKKFPNKPILKVGEENSSVEAVQTLIAAAVGKKERRKKENIDKTAAAIILQRYLGNL